MKSFSDWKIGLVLGIIVLAALSRVVPHIWNFTPIAAMALFGAAYFPNKWYAVIIPFAAMWLGDLYLINAVYAPMYPDYYGEGFHFFGEGSKKMYNIALRIMRGNKAFEGEISEDWPWTNPSYDLQLDVAKEKIAKISIDPGVKMMDVERSNNEWQNR